MPEQELNSPAAKFISSLVRSLQILCNGQVDFNESIELVGHINVRVDRKFKFDYIVDEQVSKEGGDSSTTFLSNSYHSCPPLKQPNKKVAPPEFEQDVMFSEAPQNVHKRSRQSKNSVEISGKQHHEESSAQGDESIQNYSVAIESMAREIGQSNQMVVKIEGGDDSNDCMVLPASPGDYEPVGEVSGAENYPVAGTSGSFDESIGTPINRTRKRRKVNDQSTDERESQVSRRSNSSRGSTTYNSPYPTQSCLQCFNCHLSFLHPDDLANHMYICPCSPMPYNLPPMPSSTTSTPSDTVACTMCGEVFQSSKERLQHMNTSHGVSLYACQSCDEVFGSSRLLCQHKKIFHGDHVAQLTCPLCTKTFTTALNLRGHMNMHKGSRPYKCVKCGEAFAYSQSKHRHQKLCNK